MSSKKEHTCAMCEGPHACVSPAQCFAEENAAAEQDWERICNERGWNEASQITHLEGFIRENGLFTHLAAYAAEAQREENAG